MRPEDKTLIMLTLAHFGYYSYDYQYDLRTDSMFIKVYDTDPNLTLDIPQWSYRVSTRTILEAITKAIEGDS